MKTVSKKQRVPANSAAKSAAKKAVSTISRAGARTADVLLAASWAAVAEEGDAAITELAGALPHVGVSARIWRPFEDRLADARCLHLFGASAEFLPLVESARASGVKVLLSPELWRDAAKVIRNKRGAVQKAGDWIHKTARGFFTRTPAWQRELFAAVDLLVPNSHVEAQRIARRSKVPLERMRVVPYGVDPRVAAADPQPFRQRLGERDFVLYAGTIEPKNQQLGFLWAMKNSDVPLVLLGDAAPDCPWYLDECRRVAGSRAKFIARKDVDDRMVASALTACSCLVVGAGEPAGERIALKAGASGTPLILFDGGCGSEYFGQQAVYVRADDVADIRRGVLAALDRKRNKSLAEHVCTYFSWPAVARAMRSAYGWAGRGKAAAR
jgi:glycosyltransferase involved in cell wall biosynthesis